MRPHLKHLDFEQLERQLTLRNLFEQLALAAVTPILEREYRRSTLFEKLYFLSRLEAEENSAA